MMAGHGHRVVQERQTFRTDDVLLTLPGGKALDRKAGVTDGGAELLPTGTFEPEHQRVFSHDKCHRQGRILLAMQRGRRQGCRVLDAHEAPAQRAIEAAPLVQLLAADGQEVVADHAHRQGPSVPVAARPDDYLVVGRRDAPVAGRTCSRHLHIAIG
jgi:hypothetical protein